MLQEDLQSIEAALNANRKVQFFQQYGTSYIQWEICDKRGKEGEDSHPITRTQTRVLDTEGMALLKRKGCTFTYRIERLFGKIIEGIYNCSG